MSGLRANHGRVAYGASKAGVKLMSDVLALEFGARGVRVNCVAPGPIETPMIAGCTPGRSAAVAAPRRRKGATARRTKSPPQSRSCCRPRQAISTATRLPSMAASCRPALWARKRLESPETAFMRLSFNELLLLRHAVRGDAIAADDPKFVGDAFCIARLGDDEAATLALLTPSLVKAIDEAKARNGRYRQSNAGREAAFRRRHSLSGDFLIAASDCEVGRRQRQIGQHRS